MDFNEYWKDRELYYKEFYPLMIENETLLRIIRAEALFAWSQFNERSNYSTEGYYLYNCNTNTSNF